MNFEDALIKVCTSLPQEHKNRLLALLRQPTEPTCSANASDLDNLTPSIPPPIPMLDPANNPNDPPSMSSLEMDDLYDLAIPPGTDMNWSNFAFDNGDSLFGDNYNDSADSLLESLDIPTSGTSTFEDLSHINFPLPAKKVTQKKKTKTVHAKKTGEVSTLDNQSLKHSETLFEKTMLNSRKTVQVQNPAISVAPVSKPVVNGRKKPGRKRKRDNKPAINPEAGKHIGIYGPRARKARIELHRRKRLLRDYHQIRYACRRTICHKRVRVKGRFLKRREGEAPTRAAVQIKSNNEKINDTTMVSLIKEEKKFNPDGPPSPKSVVEVVVM